MTDAKTSLNKSVRTIANFFFLIPIRSIGHILANFSGLELQKTVSAFRKKKSKIAALCSHFP